MFETEALQWIFGLKRGGPCSSCGLEVMVTRVQSWVTLIVLIPWYSKNDEITDCVR